VYRSLKIWKVELGSIAKAFVIVCTLAFMLTAHIASSVWF